MSISEHVHRLLDRGEIRSNVVGSPAIKIWGQYRKPSEATGVCHLLVMFDRRDAEHPQPVAGVMSLRDERGELEQRAKLLMRGSRRLADDHTSCVHDFRGNLRGHRLVIVGEGDLPDWLLSRMMSACVNSALANRDQLAA